jgi:DNA-binding protein WhiA
MSFSSDVKQQLCKVQTDCEFCPAAELAGILETAGNIQEEKIRIVTENKDVAEKIKGLFEACFGFSIESQRANHCYIFLLKEENQIANVKEALAFDEDLEETTPFACCVASYIRGAFLGSGSISDPHKGYHLEFDMKKNSNRLYEALIKKEISAKLVQRKGHDILYIKEYEVIASILGMMGACNAVMEVYNVQIEKEMRNSINRQVNCETANVDKVVRASVRQMEAIEKIHRAGRFSALPDTLQEMARIRQEYPEDSLKELGERLKKPIGKSGVNHRLNRLIEIAAGIQEGKR